MKAKIPFYILMTAVGAGMLCSCEDMFDTDSDSLTFDDGHRYETAADSLYTAMGILTQMQQLGERYVLFGELRGDLVNVSSSADEALQNISSFTTSEGDAYSSRRDFFSVINNCNYALARIDTTLTEHNRHVLVPEYTAITTMRAWTYLQMGLAFGKVPYIEEPILSLEDSEKDYPVIGLDELVDKLIVALQPYVGKSMPSYGTVGNNYSVNFFPQADLLLGDLYLYENRYEEAAATYYNYITRNNVVMYLDANYWRNSLANELTSNHLQTYRSEVITLIPYSSDPRAYHPNLVNLTYSSDPAILPAQWWIDEMGLKTHYHRDNETANVTSILEGDLRGQAVPSDPSLPVIGDAYVSASIGVGTRTHLINKFFNDAQVVTGSPNPNNTLLTDLRLSERVVTYRIPQLYLRFAEAANRAGYPSFAFAVIKHGLRAEVLADETKIDPAELEEPCAWMDFNDMMFDSNRGTAMRGRGLGIFAAEAYAIPEFDTLEEKVEWVEEQILEELAAETAYEGNRFFDLLRVSRHRANSMNFFAEKVARRAENPASLKAQLSNIDNLWIK